MCAGLSLSIIITDLAYANGRVCVRATTLQYIYTYTLYTIHVLCSLDYRILREEGNNARQSIAAVVRAYSPQVLVVDSPDEWRFS